MVSVDPAAEDEFIDLMMLNGVEFDLMGHVTKGSIRIDDEDWGDVNDYKELYDTSIEKQL